MMASQRITIQSSAAQTASGNSSYFLVSTATQAVCYVDITAASAVSDFDLYLQGSNDDGTTWFDVPCDHVLDDAGGAVATQRNIVNNETGTGKWTGVFKVFPYKHVRAKWALTGTSVTFSVILDVK